MHDHPGLFPHLPSKPFHLDDDYMLAPVMDTVWQTCWEFVLTHELTEAEGSAFWHGAHLAHEAMKKEVTRDEQPS